MKGNFEDPYGATFRAKIFEEHSSNVVFEPECINLFFCYPGAIKDALVKGVGVEFIPRDSEPWYGTFSGGSASKAALDFAGSCPDKQKALIISSGDGYIVNAKNPSEWKEIGLRPIMGVKVEAEKEVIILWDLVRMMCIDRHGTRWITPSISWDGIERVLFDGDEIKIDVWDAPKSCFSSATINLTTGLVIGGKSPPV